MQRLTGLDATFLYLETPSSHMHVASTAVFDPSDVPGGYSFEKVKEMVENRLPLLPPFRRRLIMVPFQLHHPLWIEDPDFDIDYHVRRAALPAPGGAKELAEFAADVMARPLHRSRPLWEMYVIEGLEDGYIATVTKVGLDLGITDQTAVSWVVFAPTVQLGPGDLSGNYAGVDASAAVGVGLGANALVGGSANSFALQPLSVQGQTGLSVAAGVQSLQLRPGR